MEKELILIENKGKEKVKIELELEFDEQIKDIETLLNNVLNAVEHQVNTAGLSSDEEEAITCSIKAKFVSKREIIENYFKPIINS